MKEILSARYIVIPTSFVMGGINVYLCFSYAWWRGVSLQDNVVENLDRAFSLSFEVTLGWGTHLREPSSFNFSLSLIRRIVLWGRLVNERFKNGLEY